jgi:EcoEI R protein C-terminal
LEERGIDFDQLRSSSNQPEADPFDLLCHLAFNGPLRTRRERADRVKKEEKSFFEKYGPEAKAIFNDLLEKYAEHGTAQFVIQMFSKSRRFRSGECYRNRAILWRSRKTQRGSERAASAALCRVTGSWLPVL